MLTANLEEEIARLRRWGEKRRRFNNPIKLIAAQPIVYVDDSPVAPPRNGAAMPRFYDEIWTDGTIVIPNPPAHPVEPAAELPEIERRIFWANSNGDTDGLPF